MSGYLLARDAYDVLCYSDAWHYYRKAQCRDIAAVLGRPEKHEGFLTVGSAWLITWAFGHLVTLAELDACDSG